MSTELSDETIIALARKHRTAGTWDSELLALVREAVEADRALRPSGGRDSDVHQVSAPVEISSCATCGHPVESGGERPAELSSGWRRVPIEPTREMLRAAGATLGMKRVDDILALHQIRGARMETWPGDGSPLVQAWRAMLAAVDSASGSQESGSTECKESSPLSPANQGIDHE